MNEFAALTGGPFELQVVYGDGSPPTVERFDEWTRAYRRAKTLAVYHSPKNGVFLFSPGGSVIEVMVNGFRKVGF